MSIGKRIREKRQALRMTQEELALKVGYTSKTTINKIESGINDIPLSKVEDFANVLNTTPAYLLGWDEQLTTDELTLFFLNRSQVRDSILNLLGYSVGVELSDGINNLILASDKGKKSISTDKVDEILTDTITYFDFALNKALQE